MKLNKTMTIEREEQSSNINALGLDTKKSNELQTLTKQPKLDVNVERYYKSKLDKFINKYYYLNPNSKNKLMNYLNSISAEDAIEKIKSLKDALDTPKIVLQSIKWCVNATYDMENENMTKLFSNSSIFDKAKFMEIDRCITELKKRDIQHLFSGKDQILLFNCLSKLKDLHVRGVESGDLIENTVSLCNKQIEKMEGSLKSEYEDRMREYSTNIIDRYVPEIKGNDSRTPSACSYR
jgi:hypothetical protein